MEPQWCVTITRESGSHDVNAFRVIAPFESRSAAHQWIVENGLPEETCLAIELEPVFRR